MRYNNVSIDILIKGKAITEYPHNGQVFVEGRDGSPFEIAVENHNRFRVEAVVSVDGLATTDGKDAGPASPGYLLEAHERVVIPGWRLDNASAAEFVFTGKGRGYASQMGGGHNTGVIGLLAYREKEQTYVAYHGSAFPRLNEARVRGIVRGGSEQMWWGASSAIGSNGFDASMPTGPELSQSTMKSATRSYRFNRTNSLTPEELVENERMWAEENVASVNNIGTGFGQATDFTTTSVSFERGDMLALVTVFYDDARGLRARGIDISRKTRVREKQQPNAFPGLSGCTPPPGWRP